MPRTQFAYRGTRLSIGYKKDVTSDARIKLKKRRMPRTRSACRGTRLVPVAGLEPARCRHQRILSPSRLPIPSHRPVHKLLYTNKN